MIKRTASSLEHRVLDTRPCTNTSLLPPRRWNIAEAMKARHSTKRFTLSIFNAAAFTPKDYVHASKYRDAFPTAAKSQGMPAMQAKKTQM